jgi:hypothetical protein
MPKETKQIITPSDLRQFREEFHDRYRVYANDWDDLLEKEVKRMFTSEKTAARVNLMLDTSLNIFRRIIRETCTVYKEPAQRILKPESSRWAELQPVLSLDTVMAEAHRVAKACSVSYLLVKAIPGTQDLRVFCIQPSQTHVETDPNDPTKLKSFSYLVKGKDAQNQPYTAWIYYDKDRRLWLNEDGTQSENPFDPKDDGKNKYGTIPVVTVPATPQSSALFDLNWNKDSFRANTIIAVLNTYMNDLVKTSSFKQLLFIGDDEIEERLDGKRLDPMSAITLPPGSFAQVMDMNTQLSAIKDVIQWKVSAIANNYGISQDNFNLTSQPASGFSLKISNHALEEIRAADIPLMAKVERELYSVIATVNNAEGLATLPDNPEFAFNPGEVEFPTAWAEEEAQRRFEIEVGASNVIDYMISQDPELSREEALKKWKAIAEENKIVKPAPSLLTQLTGRSQTQGQGGLFGQSK